MTFNIKATQTGWDGLSGVTRGCHVDVGPITTRSSWGGEWAYCILYPRSHDRSIVPSFLQYKVDMTYALTKQI